MNHEANSDKSYLWYRNHRKIAHDRKIRMQGMKSNTTALRIIDRIGKQVV